MPQKRRKKSKQASSAKGSFIIWCYLPSTTKDCNNKEKVRQKNPTATQSGIFSEASANSLWFNASADHLFELELPKG